MIRVCSFCSLLLSRFCFWNLFFLSFLSFFLASFATLTYDKTDLACLGLSSLKQKEFLLLKLWVYIFKEVL